MTYSYDNLQRLRQNSPAWRLLRAEHAPLILGFLYRAFVAENVRVLSESEIVTMLDGELFALRERFGDTSYPKSAQAYILEWTKDDKGWLRSFYTDVSDEPHYDLTTSAQKAITWIETLTERTFIGTESRLLTVFELLRQMVEGSEEKPEERIATLIKRRDEIDKEIEAVKNGDLPLLDSAGLKDRFQQFLQMSRELLLDFREVENNFRMLDRRSRERIAMWDSAKGELLSEIMGERDAIVESDQGKSFEAFWAFLRSHNRREAFTDMLSTVLELPPVQELKPDRRVRRVHHDWAKAGETTQATVRLLSKQLRQLLDEAMLAENRRILEIYKQIEGKAIMLRNAEKLPSGTIMMIDEIAPSISLPFERPLNTPKKQHSISIQPLAIEDLHIDISKLYDQFAIDRARLRDNIDHALSQFGTVTLYEVVAENPIEQGLAELLTYFHIALEWQPNVQVEEHIEDRFEWKTEGSASKKRATSLPRITFTR